MNKVKTIFVGTSEFAVPILKKLLELDYIDLISVVTQPDRPAGRKQELTPPAVKKFLVDGHFDTPILQPEKFKELKSEIIDNLKPDLIIVASYGQIIPSSILEFPKYGCLNIHASLLPDLRGAVPMPMAILKGYEKTGMTLQRMVFKLDEGDIVSQREISISKDETFETLQDKCSNLAAVMLEEDLLSWIKGDIEAQKQDDSVATYCYTTDIAKEKAEITYETDVLLSERMSRAFYPWPIVWFRIRDGKYSGKILKIYKAEVLNDDKNTEYGIENVDKRLVLKLKNGTLLLNEVQLEGKNRDLAKNYLWIAG